MLGNIGKVAAMLKRIVQLVIFTVGLALCSIPASADAPAKPDATKKEAANPYNAKNQLDLNTAPKAELMKLPGIGDAYADAIIKNRPYTNKTQLKSKAGVPAATYDKIADMIVAKQTK
jgi:DNA uptake protein ComE-like DNA-binding protein